MSTQQIEFEVGGGKKVTGGKPHWPAGLTLTLPRRDALMLLQSLTAKLADETAPELDVTLFGSLITEPQK